MSLPSQPVDYSELNTRFRIACIVNAAISFGMVLLVAIGKESWLITAAASYWQGLALFLSGVFAFCSIATNSLSGRGQLALNTGPVLCVLVTIISGYSTIRLLEQVRLL